VGRLRARPNVTVASLEAGLLEDIRWDHGVEVIIDWSLPLERVREKTIEAAPALAKTIDGQLEEYFLKKFPPSDFPSLYEKIETLPFWRRVLLKILG